MRLVHPAGEVEGDWRAPGQSDPLPLPSTQESNGRIGQILQPEGLDELTGMESRA